MDELQVFKYQNTEVRTIERDGEPWFVLKDVCSVLGITHVKDTAIRLEEDEVGQTEVIDSLGRKQTAYIINESGLYNVILRSDKPEAKPFRKWVTSEVLPSIRKHGAYMTPETLDKMIMSPDFGIKLLTALKEEQDKCRMLEATNAALNVDNQLMKPKADYFDELVDCNLLTNFRETAKQLKVPQRKFVDFLLANKYVYRDPGGKLQPYQRHVERGLFAMKEYTIKKMKWSGVRMLITPIGREHFRTLFIGAATAERYDSAQLKI